MGRGARGGAGSSSRLGHSPNIRTSARCLYSFSAVPTDVYNFFLPFSESGLIRDCFFFVHLLIL
jgi:hypothetical protein